MVGITDPAEAFFKDGVWGWTGSAWVKLPILFGYSAPYLETVEDLNADAGDNVLVGSTVPAGEVWVVTSVQLFDEDNDITRIDFHIVLNGDEHHIRCNTTVKKQSGVDLQGFWPMPAGAHGEALFEGVTVGDDLYFTLIGYKMAIAE